MQKLSLNRKNSDIANDNNSNTVVDSKQEESEKQEKSKKKCDYCKKKADEVKKLKKCATCLKTRYCSQECQRADWKNHKNVCSK